ncbi:hypothetical protein Agub_g14565 [Astrephomene gubernaculifera]|uniref:TFIIS central domain-containing protein n=1 Tax=Astrephomene gubernaculifera TaxID=47775 RepID=A0AAD3E1N3_9CHLO|nr:hypothetical protein Agub_g14565 [Astrephomene gubernaculifera]
MKRKPIWKELNLPPPSKKIASPRAAVDPIRQEASQQALRTNCVRTLLAALSTTDAENQQKQEAACSSASGGPDSGGPNPAADPSTLTGLAEAVEEALFRHHHSETGQDYKAAARTLVAGLKRNSELRGRVLCGDVPPRQLVALDPRHLATPQQQREYARLQEEETRRVTLAGANGSGSGGGIASSDYRCERCGGRSCSYLDSGRRDIGKCETWGSKEGQGSSRLVTCLGCGHRWEVDDV